MPLTAFVGTVRCVYLSHLGGGWGKEGILEKEISMCKDPWCERTLCVVGTEGAYGVRKEVERE